MTQNTGHNEPYDTGISNDYIRMAMKIEDEEGRTHKR
jgi:hypothetical protein